MQFFPAFVLLVDRQEERRRIAAVNDHRQAELAARFPDRIPARIVDLDERAVGVLVDEAEVFEDLEPARAVLLWPRPAPRPCGGRSRAAGNPTSPGRRPCRRRANRYWRRSRTGRGTSSRGTSHVRRARAEAAVEADAHGDVLGVHRLARTSSSCFGRVVQPDPRMHVDVDHRKLRPLSR